MDPIPRLEGGGHPGLESDGSTSAVGADGYDTMYHKSRQD